MNHDMIPAEIIRRAKTRAQFELATWIGYIRYSGHVPLENPDHWWVWLNADHVEIKSEQEFDEKLAKIQNALEEFAIHLELEAKP